MSQVAELERRITAALERISTGVETLQARDAGGAETLESLKASLEDEKLANAQLEERLRSIKDRQDREMKKLEDQVSADRAEMAKLDAELQKLRSLNDQLRENNAALRAANEEGVGEPHLINTGLKTEVEALRATRSAERTEVEAVLSVLEPMLDSAKEGAA